MKRIRSTACIITVSALMFSCKKNDAPPATVPKVTTGLYVLSEGTFNGNNTTLTYYSFASSKATTDYFANSNGSGLGDTGNDILVYGGKIYIVVNVSSYVEVANANDAAKEIKKIDFKNGATPRQPRYVVGYKNKVLVSSYDGTVAVIDTTTLLIEKNILVGANPEQLAVIGDNLYVANSGGLGAVPDSTVSVVNLLTYAETKKITVGVNPVDLVTDADGNVYLSCLGDYNTIGPKLVKLNSVTGTVVKSADTAVGKMKFYNGLLYVTGGYLGSPYVRTLNPLDFSQTSPNFVTDGTTIITPYGINVDNASGDVYITDGKDYVSAGEVFCFDKTGKKKFSFSVDPGRNPNTVAFIKQ